MKHLFSACLLSRVTTIVCSIVFAGSAFAQLEEVVVTAQKRAEDIQDVPISITAISGDFIEDAGMNTLDDISMQIPNLTLSKSSQVANNRIIMRGVGSVGNNAIEPSVAVFIDGVYYPRPGSVVGSLTDLEMVEVLRGPQGTLFGRNASMGALNIRTRSPGDEFEGNIRASYGNFDAIRVSGAFGGGLGANTSGRVAFQYSDRDGYGDNTFTANNSRNEAGAWEDTTIRGKLYFTPTDDLEITLSADYSSVDNEGSVIEVISDTVLPTYVPTISTVLSPVPLTPTGPAPDVTDTFDYDINQDHQDVADDEQWGIAADIQWQFGEHTIRSISSYRDWSNETFESALRLPADLFNRDTEYETETFSQELQLLSPTGGRIEYVAGFYYYDEDYAINQDFDLGVDFCSPAITNLVGAGAAASGAAATTALATGIAALPTIGPALAQTVAGGIVTGVFTTPAAITAAIPTVSAADATAALAAAAGLTPAVVGAAAVGLGTTASGICSAAAQVDSVDGQFDQESTSYAIYGQLSFHVTDQLRLTGGLRWTSDDKEGSYTQVINNPIIDSPVAPTGTPLSVNLRINESFPSLAFDDDELTLLANASYYLNDEVMLFATYSTGYKSGGFNSDGANRVIPRTFNSETVDNFEVGFKSNLFDNRMIANLTFFRTEIQDFQDRQFDGVSFIVQNAGEFTQQGIELDVQARPVDQLYIVAGLSYLDSEFDSFPDATPLPIVIATTPPGVIPPGQDLTGSRNHFSPEWQFSISGEWSDVLPNSAMSWFIRTEYSFVDEQNIGAETNGNPQSLQESYGLLGFRGGVRGPDDKWELLGYVNNVTDEGYCQTIFNQPVGTTIGLVDPATGGGMQRCVLGNPRTFGVEVGYRF